MKEKNTAGTTLSLPAIHYCKKQMFHSDGIFPYESRWIESDPVDVCSCGKLSCASCSSAFEHWFFDQAQAHVQRQNAERVFTTVSMDIQVPIKSQSKIDHTFFTDAMRVAVLKLPFADKPFFGLVDARIDEHKRWASQANWKVLAVLVTRTMSADEIESIENHPDFEATVHEREAKEDIQTASTEGDIARALFMHTFCIYHFKTEQSKRAGKVQDAVEERSGQMQRLLLHMTACIDNTINPLF